MAIWDFGSRPDQNTRIRPLYRVPSTNYFLSCGSIQKVFFLYSTRMHLTHTVQRKAKSSLCVRIDTVKLTFTKPKTLLFYLGMQGLNSWFEFNVGTCWHSWLSDITPRNTVPYSKSTHYFALIANNYLIYWSRFGSSGRYWYKLRNI